VSELKQIEIYLKKLRSEKKISKNKIEALETLFKIVSLQDHSLTMLDRAMTTLTLITGNPPLYIDFVKEGSV
jgi:hypothetical protein